MAEVVILELVLDPSKLQQGAKAASDALGGLGDKAQDTEKKVKISGNAMSSAFAATGGTVQIAQGITSTAQAFGQMNIQAGLFGASRTIMELGHTVEDFRKLSVATGAAGTAMSALGAAVARNPIGALAAAIGIAASLMGLFSLNTNKAANEWENLAVQMDKAAANDRVARLLGEPAGSRIAALRDAAMVASGKIGKPGGDVGIADFTKTLEPIGVNIMDIQKAYGERTVTGAPEPPGPAIQMGGQWKLSPQQQLDTLIRLRKNYEVANPATQPKPGAMSSSEEQWVKATRDNIERANKAMDELVDKAAQFGALIGDAFYNVASGAQTARQAIAGLVNELARAASREAFAGLFGGIARGFGKTSGQLAADLPDPTGHNGALGPVLG